MIIKSLCLFDIIYVKKLTHNMFLPLEFNSEGKSIWTQLNKSSN